MPRAAQTIDSEKTMREGDEKDDEGDEEEIDERVLSSINKQASLNNNDLDTDTVENLHLTHEKSSSRTINSSQNSIIFKACDEDDESSPLRVIIGGTVKKFKKDSRVWLHKSSARAAARKAGKSLPHGCLMTSSDQHCTSGSSTDGSLVSEIMDVCYVDACRSHSGETARETDSTISLLGDSDADLSYSEEEPDQSASDDIACKPSMSFYQSENDSETSMDSEPMEVDESPPETASNSNSTLPDFNNHLDVDESTKKIQQTPCTCPKCNDNGNYEFLEIPTNPPELQVSIRHAPAVGADDQTIKASLFEYAMKHFCGHLHETNRQFSGKVQKRKKRKRKFRPNVRKPTTRNIPPCLSCNCSCTKSDQAQSQMKPKEECLKNFNSYLISVTKGSTEEQSSSIKQHPEAPSPGQVPSLFLMAAGALQQADSKTDIQKDDEEVIMAEETDNNNTQELDETPQEPSP